MLMKNGTLPDMKQEENGALPDMKLRRQKMPKKERKNKKNMGKRGADPAVKNGSLPDMKQEEAARER